MLGVRSFALFAICASASSPDASKGVACEHVFVVTDKGEGVIVCGK